ncbi:MAG: amino acid adenylation domain-containing protein [Magnetococcales bacterium]|nr:amino acid adenylation domain-containing protein [Magnetococcales bacterium]
MNTEPNSLIDLLRRSAHSFPERMALVEGDGRRISYREMWQSVVQLADQLHALGISSGHRVAVLGEKSIETVCTFFAVMKVGAAYLPLDPAAPVNRNRQLLLDGAVRAVVLAADFYESLVNRDELADFSCHDVTTGWVVLVFAASNQAAQSVQVEPGLVDPAYILFTSGSSGRPKGVVVSHRAVLSFLGWCSKTFNPSHEDRFSSFAPLHFAMSVFDLFLAIKHGARLVLLGVTFLRHPTALIRLLATERVSIWYSTPSGLRLLMGSTALSERPLPDMKKILFAGEPFPIEDLKRLRKLLPEPDFYNLYGATEVNVCVCQPIPKIIPDERDRPFPLGKPCSHIQVRVVTEAGREAEIGEPGELWIQGKAVMSGYLQDAGGVDRKNQVLADGEGGAWHQTADIVAWTSNGALNFIGRRDRVIKRQGYRISLLEIETALLSHVLIAEAAAIARPESPQGFRIVLFVKFRGEDRLSSLALKIFLSSLLPVYMIPDQFIIMDLPKTSTGKIDFPTLARYAETL